MSIRTNHSDMKLFFIDLIDITILYRYLQVCEAARVKSCPFYRVQKLRLKLLCSWALLTIRWHFFQMICKVHLPGKRSDNIYQYIDKIITIHVALHYGRLRATPDKPIGNTRRRENIPSSLYPLLIFIMGTW